MIVLNGSAGMEVQRYAEITDIDSEVRSSSIKRWSILLDLRMVLGARPELDGRG